MNRNKWKVAAVVVLGVGMFSGAKTMHSEFVVRGLTRDRPQEEDEPARTPQDPVTAARSRRFEAIWQLRKRRDVTAQILPFLKDPFPPLRARAVRALGELESPAAEAPLQELLQRMKTEEDYDKPGGVPAVTLKLALGRIHSRDLAGQVKVATVAKSVGLSWSELRRLSQVVNNGSRRSEMVETDGNEIIEDVVDLLYSMGKKGQDVSAIADRLTLNPAQQVKIRAASLSSDQEIELIFGYFLQRGVITVDDYILMNHLVNIGPAATEMILHHLREMQQHPGRYRGLEPYPQHPGMYRKRVGFAYLFHAAAATGDKRMIPLLKYFERSSDNEVSRAAQIDRESIELKIRRNADR